MSELSKDGKTLEIYFNEANVGFCLAYYNNQVEKDCYSVIDLQKRNYLPDTTLILAFIKETLEKSNNNNLSKAYKDIYNNAYVPQYNALAPKLGATEIASLKNTDITFNK